jgi:hypothetical protein
LDESPASIKFGWNPRSQYNESGKTFWQ